MKLPTEAELIELENQVLRSWQARAYDDGSDLEYRIVRTLETIIALARDPSQLLRDLSDDDALEVALRTHCPMPGLSTRPPRKVEPAPVLSVQPKPKKKNP
jgi:hypothetical protein